MSTATTNEPKAGDSTRTAPQQKKRPIWLKILLGLAVVIAILAAFIASRPSDFHVSRSLTMAAPPATVFAQVNDFHKWDAWSPWIKLDPNATVRYEGPEAGEGAKFFWSGNAEVGEGSMTVVESKPDELVNIRLDFVKPFAGTADADFTFEPVGTNETKVTWSMSGKNNFIAKAISLVINCDKMIGDNFEQGLASMKAIVEKSS
jgi:polyketide cyclase/dehydrase/lipid transport protein